MSPRFTHDGAGTPPEAWSSRAEWASVARLVFSPSPARVVVVAAHPDDESLGAGGLIAHLTALGVPVDLVLATAGERSHPPSPTRTPADLAVRRRAEADRAWALLGGDPTRLSFLDLPDGAVTAYEDEATRRLVERIGDGRDTLLVTPWRHDGHPDHDALGRAGCRTAYRTGARLLQYPVWFWHHADPDGAPWPLLRTFAPTEADRAAKARAIAAHETQTDLLSHLLGHVLGSREAYVAEPPWDDALDALHDEHEDPWGTTSRWYEQRKRHLTLAVLPRPRFVRALDVGCSTGTLTAALAERCDAVVAVDRSPHAVRRATDLLAGRPRVEVRELDAPQEWPEGRFDLVLVSESGYFLSPAGLDALVSRIEGSLTADGVVVLAHWRHPVVGWPLDGPAVHRRFRSSTALPPVVATYADPDVEILLLARDTPRG